MARKKRATKDVEGSCDMCLFCKTLDAVSYIKRTLVSKNFNNVSHWTHFALQGLK